MKTITLPQGYRFRKTWRGKLVLVKEEQHYDMGGPYFKTKDVHISELLSDEKLQVRWEWPPKEVM